MKEIKNIFDNLINVLKSSQISTLILANFLFMFGFSMMHGTFILFTAMDVENGGLGFTEMQNGWVFAFIGVIGVII